MLTNQEIFDKAVGGLLKQGKAARKENEKGVNRCVYRTDDGLKCAVGQIIPDNLYQSGMEDLSVDVLFQIFSDEMSAIGLDMATQGHLLNDLQCVHDTSGPVYWAENFRQVAKDFNLNSGVCDAD